LTDSGGETGDPFAKPRERMVERQLRRRRIEDERVLAAMAEVPRELFVDPDMRGGAYGDNALRIGQGQTISQPWIVAFMTAMLGLDGDERVLEVGTGSGYGAAVLSRCCAEVVTIERHPELAERAAGVLAELGYSNVEVRVGDGSAGAPDRAPFGGISVTATARQGVPQTLLDQLAPGAALVCPTRSGRRERLVRVRDGVEEPLVPVRFVSLVTEAPKPPDERPPST
jgi:protein-L-isoaspartate(D-aspartate) O-methyltransferase